MIKQKKIDYLDYLRFICCLSVVMIHVFTTARTDFINHTNIEELISRCIPQILHYAVPIFFMITGVLFLDENRKVILKDYLKKYVLKYMIIILIFGGGYAFIEEVFKHNININGVITAIINMIQGKSWAHMWYMYSLVGVMLFLPIIKTTINSGKDITKYTLILLFISSVLYPLFQLFNTSIGIQLPMCSIYMFYTIYGYWLNKYSHEKRNTIIFVIAILLSILCIILFQYLSIWYNIEKFKSIGDYNSIITLLLSTSIFMLFKNIRKISNKNTLNIINLVCKESFGIYLIHMFYINIIYKLFKYNIYGKWMLLNGVIVYVIVFILSYITTYLLKKVSLMKKVLK